MALEEKSLATLAIDYVQIGLSQCHPFLSKALKNDDLHSKSINFKRKLRHWLKFRDKLYSQVKKCRLNFCINVSECVFVKSSLIFQLTSLRKYKVS